MSVRVAVGAGSLLCACFCAFSAALGVPQHTSNQAPPFSAGERAQYRASWGILGRVGTGTIEIPYVDTLRGRSTLKIVMTIRGGLPAARIDERIESWLDQDLLYSHRFVQRTRYPRFSRDRERDFFPHELRWTGHTNGRTEEGILPTANPLDDLGFLYHARTLDLEIGREYTIERYWNANGNPVKLKVLRAEIITVPAGRFRTIVVQPVIRTSSLFAEDGEAEVYFADSPNRQIVMLRAKVSIGTLTLRLEEYQPGSAPR